jgi:hypothetical protein
MQISLCFISRQSGAHLTRNITKLNVITLIIGKILEENLIFSISMQWSYAKIGKLVLLLLSMRKDVNYRLLVSNPMVGRNMNIILLIIRQKHAKTKNVALIWNVHSSMVTKIVE